MKKTETQVVVKEQTAVAVAQDQPQADAVLKSDIILPQLLLMQGLSEFVGERKAQTGDIVRSTPVEILGGPDKAVDFIPLTFTNEWRIEEIVKNKGEFRGREPRNSSNESLPWDFEKNGTKWRRTKVINVYALLPGDVAAEIAEQKKNAETGEAFDLDKVLLPVVISFRSTGYNAGKAVATHFAKAQSAGAKPYFYSMKLSCKEDKNDKGQFYVYEVASGKSIAKDYLARAEQWAKTLKPSQVQIDEPEAVAPPGESAF